MRLDLFKARAQQMTADQQISMILKACDLAGRHGWSVDLYVPGRTCLDIAVSLERASCPITVAHMGYLTHAEGITDAECEHFVDVVRESRRIWPKLSGAYRYGPGPGQARAQMLARALLRAAPTRVLWGSDWPHVMAPAQDSGVLLQNAAQHAIEPRDLYAMLVENPATLYGF